MSDSEDNTVRRCIGYAKGWGYGGLVVTNLYAFRATDPKELWAAWHHERVGPDNDRTLLDVASGADLVVCGWGQFGSVQGRGEKVREILDLAGIVPRCLKQGSNGEPAHPLYLRGDLVPIPLDVSLFKKSAKNT